jgi:hypothetical protein
MFVQDGFLYLIVTEHKLTVRHQVVGPSKKLFIPRFRAI